MYIIQIHFSFLLPSCIYPCIDRYLYIDVYVCITVYTAERVCVCDPTQIFGSGNLKAVT